MKNLILFLGLGLRLESSASDLESVYTNDSIHLHTLNEAQIFDFITNPATFQQDNYLSHSEIKKNIYKIFSNDRYFSLIKSEEQFIGLLNTKETWSQNSICKMLLMIDKREEAENGTLCIY